jgi:hypothetical protein
MVPTKKWLDLGFFAPINKEEMERRLKLEFAVLNNKLEKKMHDQACISKAIGGEAKEGQNDAIS